MYKWDRESAMRKIKNTSTVTVNAGPLAVSVPSPAPHNPNRDALRNCARCGRHYNYHKDGKCPK